MEKQKSFSYIANLLLSIIPTVVISGVYAEALYNLVDSIIKSYYPDEKYKQAINYLLEYIKRGNVKPQDIEEKIREHLQEIDANTDNYYQVTETETVYEYNSILRVFEDDTLDEDKKLKLLFRLAQDISLKDKNSKSINKCVKIGIEALSWALAFTTSASVYATSYSFVRKITEEKGVNDTLSQLLSHTAALSPIPARTILFTRSNKRVLNSIMQLFDCNSCKTKPITFCGAVSNFLLYSILTVIGCTASASFVDMVVYGLDEMNFNTAFTATLASFAFIVISTLNTDALIHLVNSLKTFISSQISHDKVKDQFLKSVEQCINQIDKKKLKQSYELTIEELDFDDSQERVTLKA